MKQILWIMIFVIVGLMSCKLTSSKLSSASVKFPTDLPSDVKGYSICVEKVDKDDKDCSDGFFKKQDVTEDSLEMKVNTNCAKGYRLKMWLWDENKKPSYGMDTKFGDDFKYEDGYINIPKEKLKGDKLEVKLHFLSVSGKSSKVDVEIETVLDDGTSNIEGGSSGQTGGNTGIEVNTSCKVSSDSGAGGDKKEEAPTGSIISKGTAKPEIKASSYPSMVIYTFTTGCEPCNQLKNWIKNNSSKFKDKMYIYQNDVGLNSGINVSNCSGGTSRPVVEFYNKDGSRTSDCLKTFSSSNPAPVSDVVDRLTK